jgi:hypothetical protein
MRVLILSLTLLLPSFAFAQQTTCNQGSGSSAVTPWKVSGVISGGTISLTPASTSAATSECLVTNSAGGTTCPATPLSGRIAVELFNNGPNIIYCTVDGSAPVVNKARPIAPQGAWSPPVGSAITIKCIAATAAQLTTAATIVTEVK